MPESSAEMFDRVRLMARVDTDWDLSDNDTAALRHVLAEAEAREASVPTAAEVIEAAEATLTAIAARCVPLGEDSGDTGTVIIAEAGLAAIARWKEANGGK